MTDRKSLVTLGQLLEVAERYKDMVKNMKAVAECATKEGTELTIDERNLLSVAYKNAVGERRSSHRAISNWLRDNKCELPQVKQVKDDVEKELNDICSEVLDLLDKHLIPLAGTPESKVFYLKMKGDYFRYKAEVAADDKRDDIISQSEDAYKQALDVSEKEMPTTHPIRLGLALNFSVFYYEIKNSPDDARALAKKAFDEAIVDLDNTNPESQKDSTLIMQLLRDNMALWTADVQFDGEGEGGEQPEQTEQTTEK
ncbi:unnamed protein product [Ophioblennius macclurei]